MQPLTLSSYPRAILHIDGDAFFASCEQAKNPRLKGKPVITGKERGIVASMSYEAKARGITRGMRLFEVSSGSVSNPGIPEGQWIGWKEFTMALTADF